MHLSSLFVVSPRYQLFSRECPFSEVYIFIKPCILKKKEESMVSSIVASLRIQSYDPFLFNFLFDRPLKNLKELQIAFPPQILSSIQVLRESDP